MFTVADMMSSPAHVVHRETLLDEVDRELQEHSVSALPVVGDSGELVGVVSRIDLVRAARSPRRSEAPRTITLPPKLVSSVMSRPITARPHEPLLDAAERMVEHRIHRVVVVSGDAPVGVLSTSGVVRAVELIRLEAPLMRVMTPTLATVHAHETMDRALVRLLDAGVHGLVVERDGVPVGILSLDELLIAQHWPASSSVEDWMMPRVLCLPSTMPLHRAATHMLVTSANHVVVMNELGMCGVATGMDFAVAYVDSHRQAVA